MLLAVFAVCKLPGIDAYSVNTWQNLRPTCKPWMACPRVKPGASEEISMQKHSFFVGISERFPEQPRDGLFRDD